MLHAALVRPSVVRIKSPNLSPSLSHRPLLTRPRGGGANSCRRSARECLIGALDLLPVPWFPEKVRGAHLKRSASCYRIGNCRSRSGEAGKFMEDREASRGKNVLGLGRAGYFGGAWSLPPGESAHVTSPPPWSVLSRAPARRPVQASVVASQRIPIRHISSDSSSSYGIVQPFNKPGSRTHISNVRHQLYECFRRLWVFMHYPKEARSTSPLRIEAQVRSRAGNHPH